MAKLDLKWELHGTEATGANPPIPVYQCKVGIGEDGKNWACRAKYKPEMNLYLVEFDYEDDDDPLFIKNEVIEREIPYDYWEARRRVYHTTWCKYEAIQDVIRNFITEQHIIAYDVIGKKVV